MEKYFHEFVGIDPGTQRSANVHVEFVFVADGGEDRESEEPAGVVIEAGARPDVTPRRASDEVLERGGELGGTGNGTVDVGVAEHLASYGHAGRHRGATLGERRCVRGNMRCK